MNFQWRWPVGMPLCRNLGKGLWEVRSSLPSDRIARVIFCAHEGELVALHGFMSTPGQKVASARAKGSHGWWPRVKQQGPLEGAFLLVTFFLEPCWAGVTAF